MPAGIAIDITSPSRGVVQVETIPASALETRQNIVFEEKNIPTHRNALKMSLGRVSFDGMQHSSTGTQHVGSQRQWTSCQGRPWTSAICLQSPLPQRVSLVIGGWVKKNFIKMHPTTKRKLKIKCWRTQKHLPRVSKRSSRRFAHWKRPAYVSGFSVLKKVVHLHWQETLFKLDGCSALKKNLFVTSFGYAMAERILLSPVRAPSSS